MSAFEYIIFGVFVVTFSSLLLSIFIYVPFYVYQIKKYDLNNSTRFNTEDWWDPTYLLGTVLYFAQKKYKVTDVKSINFHGSILTWILGYSGIVFFIFTTIIILYLLLVGPTYE